MDSIDFSIINFLRKNAKIPIAELSEQIGISGAGIHKRIKKLESKKIFIGSQINFDPKKVGFTTLAFVGIYLEKAIDVNFAIKTNPNYGKGHGPINHLSTIKVNKKFK